MNRKEKIPYHIAVIMDGNGRWAKARRLPRSAGHYAGVKRVREIVREAKGLGVKMLTVFAFSTENWSRPKKEIILLFTYMDRFLKSYRSELIREHVRFRIIGRRDRIDKKILKRVEKLEEETKHHRGFFFNVAVDYGARWEIIQAVKKTVNDVREKGLTERDITEDYFENNLTLAGEPDPDLLIRTSGEQRISNFLLWQLAYSELYFPAVHWPDFGKEQLKEAIRVYQDRERRFGKVTAS